MQYLDFFMGNMFFKNITDFKTGIIWLDFLLFSIAMLLFSVISNDQKYLSKVFDFLKSYFYQDQEKNKIKFEFKSGEESLTCKGLFHFANSKKILDSNIKCLSEDVFKKYDWRSSLDIETSNLFRVDQTEPFVFTKDIMGKVTTEETESTAANGKVIYNKEHNLILYSNKLLVDDLLKFAETCKENYKEFNKNLISKEQSLITIETNDTIEDSKNSIKVSRVPWDSNVNFNNRFFPEKDKILNTIDHFLNNRDWFIKKGLNYTLGILLSGRPGCGKTSFINALVNYTGRHCIELKLHDEFDFSKLKDILTKDEIEGDLVIPKEKRIIVIEDIDCMGNIVKDRDLKLKENEDAETKIKGEMIRLLSEKSFEVEKGEVKNININKASRNENNNLSYLLNILDGINGASGRILVMTTNKPEVLDSALIRPGRIDINLNFDYSNLDNLKEILFHYWKLDNKSDTKLSRLIESNLSKKCDKIFTAAEIVSYCREKSSLSETIDFLNFLSNN